MPELAGSIDLTTDSIEGGTAALRRQTEAWKENAKAQAYQDALSEIYAAQAEAELEREKNLVLVRNAEADLRDMETERNELIRQRQEMESDPSLYDAEKYQQMEQRLLELNNEYFDADVNLGKFQEALAESDRLLADAEQKTKEYDDALKNLARRTSMEVEFDGASITKSIRPYLLGLTYTDNEEGQADDLRLCLQDRGGLWRESWLAAMLEGAVKSRPLKIRAAIVRENWTGGGRDQRLDCGSFELDAAELSTPPSELVIKATALPFSGQIRQTKKSRAWENYRLSGIAREMAKAAGLGCMYEAKTDPRYDRQEQRKQSDIDFLSRLCGDAGLSLKATDGMLVVFDQAAYEKKPPVKTIQPGKGYLSARLSAGTAGTKYASCRVRYTEPSTGRCIEGVAYSEDYDSEAKNNQQLEVTARVSSQGEAQALAANRLRMHNKFSKTASFTFPGDPVLLGGNTVLLSGWGPFDGKYMISQAVHTVDGGGYVTKVNLRRCLEG